MLGDQIALIEIYESGRGRRPSTYATDIKIKSGTTFSSLTRMKVRVESPRRGTIYREFPTFFLLCFRCKMHLLLIGARVCSKIAWRLIHLFQQNLRYHDRKNNVIASRRVTLGALLSNVKRYKEYLHTRPGMRGTSDLVRPSVLYTREIINRVYQDSSLFGGGFRGLPGARVPVMPRELPRLRDSAQNLVPLLARQHE